MMLALKASSNPQPHGPIADIRKMDCRYGLSFHISSTPQGRTLRLRDTDFMNAIRMIAG
jgi:hypothetical protein